MRDPAEQGGPLTPIERGFFVFLLTVILGLFGAEVIRDYEPRKLAALFFLLWMPPLLVLHEAGHALTALLLGWHVRLIVIGCNREVFRFRYRGVPIVIKLIPLSGFVRPVPGHLSSPRLRLALIYLAGPGIELLLLAVLVLLFGPQAFLTLSDDIGVIALQGLAVAILYSAFVNLIPIPFQSRGRLAVSDGLGFFKSFFLPDEEFAALMYSPEEAEPEDDWWQRGGEGYDRE